MARSKKQRLIGVHLLQKTRAVERQEGMELEVGETTEATAMVASPEARSGRKRKETTKSGPPQEQVKKAKATMETESEVVGTPTADDRPQYELIFEAGLAYVATGDHGEDPGWRDIINEAWADAKRAGVAHKLAGTYGKILSALKAGEREGPRARQEESAQWGGLNLADLRGTADLPKFSGEVAEFRNWQRRFQVEVDMKSGFSEAEKLSHLQKCMSGEAKILLDRFDVLTAGDYGRAWTLLRETYDSKYATFKAHLEKVEKVRSCAAGAEKELIGVVGTLAAALEALKATFTMEEVVELMFVRQLEKALDRTSLDAWETEREEGKLPTWAAAEKFALSRVRKWAAGTQPVVKEERAGTSAQRQTQVAHRGCFYCTGAHGVAYCDKFLRLNANQRKAAAEQAGKCPGCYGTASHRPGECRICPHCGGRHIPLFCARVLK